MHLLKVYLKFNVYFFHDIYVCIEAIIAKRNSNDIINRAIKSFSILIILGLILYPQFLVLFQHRLYTMADLQLPPIFANTDSHLNVPFK